MTNLYLMLCRCTSQQPRIGALLPKKSSNIFASHSSKDFKADLLLGPGFHFILYFDGGNEDNIIDDNEGECDTIIGHYYITTGTRVD